jgi:hypothetical protein
MSREFSIGRYAAYFRGWCQAFGEHESITDEASGIIWLFNQGQLGFILPEEQRRSLYREVLHRGETPLLIVDPRQALVGDIAIRLLESDRRGLPEIRGILEAGGDASVFLTSHFMYGTGTRIITLSDRRPLSIIYKAIGEMRVRLN